MRPPSPPPAPQSEDPDRVALLIEMLAADPVARRLALSWPLVDARHTTASWATVTGVTRGDVDRAGAMLRAHQICRDDGTVDPLALRVIRRMASAAMGRGGG